MELLALSFLALLLYFLEHLPVQKSDCEADLMQPGTKKMPTLSKTFLFFLI